MTTSTTEAWDMKCINWQESVSRICVSVCYINYLWVINCSLYVVLTCCHRLYWILSGVSAQSSGILHRQKPKTTPGLTQWSNCCDGPAHGASQSWEESMGAEQHLTGHQRQLHRQGLVSCESIDQWTRTLCSDLFDHILNKSILFSIYLTMYILFYCISDRGWRSLSL